MEYKWETTNKQYSITDGASNREATEFFKYCR
jgi:hypothetical protein